MKRNTRWLSLVVLLAACTSADDGPTVVTTPDKDRDAAPWIAKTAASKPPEERRSACVELGRIGGNAARERLLELLTESTRDLEMDGPIHLYAAAGLTVMRDAGTAVPMLLALSTINPNDNIAALASEARSEEYYPVDAQLCDALLGLGLFEVEEDLVAQLRRRDRIRVLIDAYAVLRRHTGKDLPFRYNGSYEAKNADADRWQEWLRSTRAERRKQRPFDAANPEFAASFQRVVDDLGTDVMNNLLMARKVVQRVGVYAVPFLLKTLASDNVTWQREAALMLGRIGSIEAAAGLRDAVALDNAAARKNAVEALAAVGDRDAGTLVTTCLTDAGVRAAAAGYLGVFGDADALAPLQKALDGESLPDTRSAIAAAIKAVQQK